MGLIRLAIPGILGLLLLELGWAFVKRLRVHRFADSLADVGCAAMSQVVGLAVTALSVGAYALTARALSGRIPQLAWPAGTPLLAWLGVFLLVDLGQYLVHRLSHRVSLLWACHSVHHSSEELNYAVGLRNSSFHGFFIWVFFLPLAAAGIPWNVVATCYGLNVLYQFWLHTRLIGNLGWLELVFNTPSHHRVHHGRDAKYLDRNFAGVLIVWDRMFGTFQREEEEPLYGTLTPIASWNPIWANLHGFALITRGWREAADWRNRLRALLGPPGGPAESAAPSVGRGNPPSRVAVYSAVQLAAAVVVTLRFVLPATEGAGPRAAGGALVLATLGVVGGLLDERPWALPAEGLRLLAAGLLAVALPLTPIAHGAVAVMVIASLLWLGWRPASRFRTLHGGDGSRRLQRDAG
jgi:sterol desaturase/sphingolipid hydroxylase (fatty acid hydroxylase superfamily)